MCNSAHPHIQILQVLDKSKKDEKQCSEQRAGEKMYGEK